MKEQSFTEPELLVIEEETAKAIEEVTKFALESPYPSPEEALEDVYA